MGMRESVLPEDTLTDYIHSFLSRRHIFVESGTRFGTPQYFFDGPSLVLRLKQFQKVFADQLNSFQPFYAVKSNSFRGICRRVVTEGWGLDVSSGFELSLALATDCKRIIFSGPGKTDDELTLALHNRDRVIILLDSPGELGRLTRLLKSHGSPGTPVKAGVRVSGDRHKGWSKFGVPLRDLHGVFQQAADAPGIEPCGIQFHTSWNLGPASQVAMIRDIGSHLRREMPAQLSSRLTFLDIGGGFWPEAGEWLNPAHTLKGQILRILDPQFSFPSRHYRRKAKTLAAFAAAIASTIQDQGPPLNRVEVWTEPGRWISTPAMHILLSVVDKKGPKTFITDGGTNLLGWERPLTEFIPLINLSRPGTKESKAMVYGSLCTPMDIWGESFFGDGLEVGDILLVPDQGAYTYSLRQSFIKPRSRVIHYDEKTHREAEGEEEWGRLR